MLGCPGVVFQRANITKQLTPPNRGPPIPTNDSFSFPFSQQDESVFGALFLITSAQKRDRKAELEAMRAAAKELDAMIASWGATEDELIAEYKQIRRAAREKKRSAK